MPFADEDPPHGEQNQTRGESREPGTPVVSAPPVPAVEFKRTSVRAASQTTFWAGFVPEPWRAISMPVSAPARITYLGGRRRWSASAVPFSTSPRGSPPVPRSWRLLGPLRSGRSFGAPSVPNPTLARWTSRPRAGNSPRRGAPSNPEQKEERARSPLDRVPTKRLVHKTSGSAGDKSPRRYSAWRPATVKKWVPGRRMKRPTARNMPRLECGASVTNIADSWRHRDCRPSCAGLFRTRRKPIPDGLSTTALKGRRTDSSEENHEPILEVERCARSFIGWRARASQAHVPEGQKGRHTPGKIESVYPCGGTGAGDEIGAYPHNRELERVSGPNPEYVPAVNSVSRARPIGVRLNATEAVPNSDAPMRGNPHGGLPNADIPCRVRIGCMSPSQNSRASVRVF